MFREKKYTPTQKYQNKLSYLLLPQSSVLRHVPHSINVDPGWVLYGKTPVAPEFITNVNFDFHFGVTALPAYTE